MSTLFSSVAEGQHRYRASTAISAFVHVAAVALAISVAPSSNLPVTEHASATRLYWPAPNVRTDTVRRPLPAAVVAPSSPAASDSVRAPAPEIRVGAFDPSITGTGAAAPGYRGSGEIVVGGLGGGTANRSQFRAGGGVAMAGFPAFSDTRRDRQQSTPQEASDEPARLLSAPEPLYTEEAKRLKITGEVVLEVELTTSATVRVLRVVSGLGYGLDEAAIDAVKQTRCKPAIKAGRPVNVTARISVVFKLT